MQIRQKKGKFYLIHSYREKGKVKNFEKYIGGKPPYEYQEEEFIYDFCNLRWIPKIKELIGIYQIKSKKMPKSLISKNLRAFGIRFTHNTNKIEGSTLSESDTHLLLEYDQLPKNTQSKKKAGDIIESKVHMRTYEEMIETQEDLSLGLILRWHKEIFSATHPDHAGLIRNGPVFISGSNYVPPPSRYEIDILLDELFQWYNDRKERYNPVFLAALFHFKFVSIHPFEDGNGRISRLVMNYILHKNGYLMFDIEAKQRNAYFKALEKSNIKDTPIRFITWFFPRYLTSTEKMLKSLGFV